MNEKEMFKSINKGVPNFVSIEIPVDTIINECASDQDLLKKEISEIREQLREYLITRMGFAKANNTFFVSLKTTTNYKDSSNSLYISPKPFIVMLKKILGVAYDGNSFNDLTLKEQLLSRVEKLSQITTPDELQREFPYIYADYELSKNQKKKIDNMQKEIITNFDLELMDKLQQRKRMFYFCALSTDFQEFIYNQTLMYRNFILKRQFVEKHLNETPLDLSKFEGLDKEKFEMLLAYTYLQEAEYTSDHEKRQKCIYYVSTYLRETKTSKTTVRNHGVVISFDLIKEKYKKILEKDPRLNPIDLDRQRFEGYHYKHVQNHIKKYYGHRVMWTLIPEGFQPNDLDQKVYAGLNERYKQSTPEEKEQRIREGLELYERKINFYESTNYIARVYGKDKFDGYVGYIYPNGQILSEKFFEDYKKFIPCTKECIYNFTIYNFEELSKHSKLTLIKDKKCKRILHAGEWEKRNLSVIEQPPIAPEEDIKKLILRCQEIK